MVLSQGNLKTSWLLRRRPRVELHKVVDYGLHLEKVKSTIRSPRIGIYVHVPYCRAICPFCPYFREVLRTREELEKYFEALYREVELYGKLLEDKKLEVVEIHVGGGTPSLVPGKLYEKLYKLLSEYFSVKVGMGIEANPEDLKNSKVAEDLYASGVDEVSIGAQSFTEKVLKALGRKHSVEDNYRAIENSIKAGFKWINVDVMFLAPSIKGYVELSEEEGLKAFVRDLEIAAELGAHQVTYYPTVIPRHSPGYKLVELGRLVQDENSIDTYVEKALDLAESSGLFMVRVYSLSRKRYEYATVNLEMVGPLIGLGAGAWSNTGFYQYINIHDAASYYELLRENKPPALYSRSLSRSSIAWRLLFDQLSTGSVKREAFDIIGLKRMPLGVKAFLELMSLAGLAERKGSEYRLTRRGVVEVYKSVINYVIEVPVKATGLLSRMRKPLDAPDKLVV
ncbi:MAG: radical SAM protein [Desulfurococcaceae archaeon]